MFTGLIDHCAKISARRPAEKGYDLVIDSQFKDLQLGESIAVNGVCLTVDGIDGSQFRSHCSTETQRLTNLDRTKSVNLERALKLSDRLGGHFVSGHVDSLARLIKRESVGEDLNLTLQLEAKTASQFCTHKGSITLNGISLTINTITDHQFSVMIIPHTQKRTNLTDLKIGDHVNIECDMLAKMVGRLLHLHHAV